MVLAAEALAFGQLNGHSIGIITKELVRRAIKVIRNERTKFEIEEKKSDYKDYDIVTSADHAAQKIYLKCLQECFPDFGIVAEEENFRKPCLLKGDNVYFSVDPLDGTKAFGRRQSNGVGTQIALRCGGKIVCAWVGDCMTQEIYGYRPGSESVWRISGYETYEKLSIDNKKLLKDQYLLMRCGPWGGTGGFFQGMVAPSNTSKRPKLFRDVDVEGGSIGLSFARLWKSEVGSLVMEPYAQTPWDTWPYVGISKKLGFVFLKTSFGTCDLECYEPIISNEILRCLNAILVIHESRMEEFMAWQDMK